jgi:hypothetical protein
VLAEEAQELADQFDPACSSSKAEKQASASTKHAHRQFAAPRKEAMDLR